MNKSSIPSTINSTQFLLDEIRSRDELPFQDVLSNESLKKHLSKVAYRDRIFTPELTLYGFLSQAIGADQSCQASVCQITAHLISQGAEAPSPNTAAYCKARARLPEDVLSGLTRESGQQLEEQAKSAWLWRGRHVKLVDGSTLSMPDTLENQKFYPQPDTQKKELVFQ